MYFCSHFKSLLDLGGTEMMFNLLMCFVFFPWLFPCLLSVCNPVSLCISSFFLDLPVLRAVNSVSGVVALFPQVVYDLHFSETFNIMIWYQADLSQALTFGLLTPRARSTSFFITAGAYLCVCSSRQRSCCGSGKARRSAAILELLLFLTEHLPLQRQPSR